MVVDGDNLGLVAWKRAQPFKCTLLTGNGPNRG
jgi:hypothetical protein